MNVSIFILVITQILYTATDFWGKVMMSRSGFSIGTIISFEFLWYYILRIIPTIGQLYVFSQNNLGKSMALFGAVSIVLSNIIGILFLSESLTTVQYIGTSLAVLAFIVLGIK